MTQREHHAYKVISIFRNMHIRLLSLRRKEMRRSSLTRDRLEEQKPAGETQRNDKVRKVFCSTSKPFRNGTGRGQYPNMMMDIECLMALRTSPFWIVLFNRLPYMLHFQF